MQTSLDFSLLTDFKDVGSAKPARGHQPCESRVSYPCFTRHGGALFFGIRKIVSLGAKTRSDSGVRAFFCRTFAPAARSARSADTPAAPHGRQNGGPAKPTPLPHRRAPPRTAPAPKASHPRRVPKPGKRSVRQGPFEGERDFASDAPLRRRADMPEIRIVRRALRHGKNPSVTHHREDFQIFRKNFDFGATKPHKITLL